MESINKLNKYSMFDPSKAYVEQRSYSTTDLKLDELIFSCTTSLTKRNYGFRGKEPEGQQAWKELQGQTIEELKSSVTKSIKTDKQGNRILSPSRFDSFVKELDQDGKLDYLFGKSGAEEIRNLLETTMMTNSPLKGAVNTSNTASALIRGLDAVSNFSSSIPLVGGATKYVASKAKESALKKQVEEAVNFDPKKLAEQLRKEQP
jgi:hypothetical protein